MVRFCHKSYRKAKKKEVIIYEDQTDAKSIHQREADHDIPLKGKINTIGHIEVDLVEGLDHKSFILTVNDKATMTYLTYRCKSKKASDVNKVIRTTLQKFADLGITPIAITSDNEKEFS